MLIHIKKDALRRMKIIRGQVNKIYQMIEKDEYCLDVLTQSLAVQNALKQVDAKIFESHLKTCLQKQMKDGKSKNATEELIKIFQRSIKNN